MQSKWPVAGVSNLQGALCDSQIQHVEFIEFLEYMEQTPDEIDISLLTNKGLVHVCYLLVLNVGNEGMIYNKY